MKRIHAKYIRLDYTVLAQTISKNEVVKVLASDERVDQYAVAKVDDHIVCLVYGEKKFDICSGRRFIVNKIIPQVKAVHSEELEDLLNELRSDPQLYSRGKNMPDRGPLASEGIIESDELRKANKEIEELRAENNKLRQTIKTIKKRLQTNVNYNTVVNMQVIFNTKVNNLGEENIDFLTMDDKKEILSQRMDVDVGLKCIEKIRCNPSIIENNNVHMTNGKTEELIVYRDGIWKREKDYFATINEIIRSDMNKLKRIASDPIPEICNEKRRRVIDFASEKYINYDSFIQRKLTDLIYSNTKTMFLLSDPVTDCDNEK